MRIDQLQLSNFKCFESREFVFHPQFNLIVGSNGSGKTSVLDALAVAAGSWLLGMRGADSRHIRANELRLCGFQNGSDFNWEPQFPCEVAASGLVQGKAMTWKRGVLGPKGRTTQTGARAIKLLASQENTAVSKGETNNLPLISYYGTGRLWLEPRESFQVTDPAAVTGKEGSTRLAGYENSVDPRLSVAQLSRYFARQTWIAFQYQNEHFPAFAAVRRAIVDCLEGANDIRFDARLGEVVADMQNGVSQPFSNLSDGQRCMLAMVGDIAQKATRLNPHLGGEVLQETQGIVLIDELDLHLHPVWQRRVIEDLRNTFPRIQFICTTHSPFLIQSLRCGEELLMLAGQPTAELNNLSIAEIAQGIQGVSRPEVGLRYAEMKDVARNYLATLEEASMAPPEKLTDFTARLAQSIGPW